MLHNGSFTYAYFFWILGNIKIKFVLMLVCCMTNISNMFLVYCWRLETSSRLFYDIIKMTIWRESVIFNSWHLTFWTVPYRPFQKNETLESWHNWLQSNWRRLLNLKKSKTLPQSSKLSKRFLKIIVLAYIYQLAKFGDLLSCPSKDSFKIAPCLMY